MLKFRKIRSGWPKSSPFLVLKRDQDYLLFLTKICLLLYMSVLSACISTSVPGAHGGKKGSDPLELGLQIVVSHHVGC